MRAAWWWIDRWRKSTAYTDMSLAEQGAYRNLLDELWLRDGLLPPSERALAKISGDAIEWPKVRDAVMARFVRTEDGYRNATHDEIQKESQARAEKQRRYRQRKRNDDGNVTRNETSNVTPSPSPSPDQTPDSEYRSPGSKKTPTTSSASADGDAPIPLLLAEWNAAAVRHGCPRARAPKSGTANARNLAGLWRESGRDLDVCRRAFAVAATRYGAMKSPPGLWNMARPANRGQYLDAEATPSATAGRRPTIREIVDEVWGDTEDTE